MARQIFETAVYDGRWKTWRILNTITATVYSSDFPTEADALNAIEDGQERAGGVVKRLSLAEIRDNLPRT